MASALISIQSIKSTIEIRVNKNIGRTMHAALAANRHSSEPKYFIALAEVKPFRNPPPRNKNEA